MIRSRASQPRRRAFTLFELVLVLVMIAILMGVAAPSLRGFLAGSRSRDASENLLALTRLARERAIADRAVHRLHIDVQTGTYWVQVQEGQRFVQTGTDFGQMFTLPDGMRVELSRADHIIAGSWIDFHPSGRTDPGTIRLTNTLNELTVIHCPSPAETFRILTNEEASRL
jgi:prepilin-type N-terminal cleavage/methylation domain-containing protein